MAVVEARKSRLQCYGYPFWSAVGKQASPSVLDVPSSSQGMAAGPPHWTQGWLQAATCLFKVTSGIQWVGVEPKFLSIFSLDPPILSPPPSQPLLCLCVGASRFPEEEGCWSYIIPVGLRLISCFGWWPSPWDRAPQAPPCQPSALMLRGLSSLSFSLLLCSVRASEPRLRETKTDWWKRDATTCVFCFCFETTGT